MRWSAFRIGSLQAIQGAPMQRVLKTLAEELLAWRATLVQMRGTNEAEVDSVVDRIDASIKSVSALRAADDIAQVTR